MIEGYQRPRRYINKQRHECGCETVFDVQEWRSKFVIACEEHAAIPIVDSLMAPTGAGASRDE